MSISWQHKPLFSDPYSLYMTAILETGPYHFPSSPLSLSRVGHEEVLLLRVPKKSKYHLTQRISYKFYDHL